MRRTSTYLFLAVALQACGSPTSPPGRLVLAIAPTPIRPVPVPIPCPAPCNSTPWTASWRLTIGTNTAGRLERVDAAVIRLGTEVAARHYGARDFIEVEGAGELSAGASLVLQQGIQYPVPLANRAPAVIEVSVRFVPDAGPALEESVRVPIS